MEAQPCNMFKLELHGDSANAILLVSTSTQFVSHRGQHLLLCRMTIAFTALYTMSLNFQDIFKFWFYFKFFFKIVQTVSQAVHYHCIVVMPVQKSIGKSKIRSHP